MTRAAAPLRNPLLSVEGLQVDRLGQPVVSGVDIAVNAGEVTVLLGANGAGKSSFLDAISGVIPATRGRLVLDGIDITRLSRRQRVALKMAYVQQGRTIFPSLTVQENLLVTAAKTEQAFDLFPELRSRAAVKAASLSGGEQQMVVLGRALLQQPRILLIDELSLGLAPVVVERMLGAVADMVADGVGVLLVEQFADRALAIGHEAAVFARGEVVLRGRASEVRSQPERLRAAYLGELD